MFSCMYKFLFRKDSFNSVLWVTSKLFEICSIMVIRNGKRVETHRPYC